MSYTDGYAGGYAGGTAPPPAGSTSVSGRMHPAVLARNTVGPRLHLVPVGNSQLVGYKSGENWEIVSERFGYTSGREEDVDPHILTAWTDNSGAAAATLKAALDAALQTAGFRHIDGTDLT